MKPNSRRILIKNMVCNRCVFAVQHIFDTLKIPLDKIEMGEVVLSKEVAHSTLKTIVNELEKLGFERIETRGNKLIEDVKKLVIKYLEQTEKSTKISLSSYITNALPYDYSYLSDLFSKIEQKTIEQFFIYQRIEKVKALINFNQFTLTEIAFQMGFSSVNQLSAQFKKVTNMTPSAYRKLENTSRKSIDSI